MGDNRLRRAWRDLALATATRLVAGSAQPEPDPPRRVLFLRHDKIGDMLMSTGVIRAIATAHPGIALDVLASPSNAPVLDGMGEVREVIAHRLAGARDAWRVGRSLRGRRYDAVVDGLVLTHRVSAVVALLMAGTRASARIGMGGGRQQEHVYTHRVPPPPDAASAHHVRWLAQLAAPFGVDPTCVPHPTLVLSADERTRAETAWGVGRGDTDGSARRPRLLVNVSAGTWHRRWTDEQFARVLAHVAAHRPEVQLAVVGEPRDRGSAVALAAAVGARSPETPALRDALALVAAADAVLTPDTAIGHAAAAFRRPCVAMILPRTERFAPYETPGEILVSPGPLLPSLDADAVIAAVERVLVPVLAQAAP